MEQIRMVDLTGQYRRLKGEIDAAIREVIDSTAFINGPAVGKFATGLGNYLGVKHVVPCGNGTDALQVALMAIGLKPGDEVITPDFTFIATAEVVALLGAKPVFVDVDPHTFNITPEAVRKAITPRTRAIVPVHLFGQCADMEPILELAREHNLYVIEDAAQALGAEYKGKGGTTGKAGTLGHIGCTSFFPSKNLGAYGDGGAIFTESDELAASMRSIVNHGMKARYYHDRIGVNSRLDTLQAAILQVKLKYLDDFNTRRQEAAARYDEALKLSGRFDIPARSPFSTHIFHQYTLKTKGIDRNRLREFLHEKNIPAMVYYPVPLHAQKAYAYLGYRESEFPVTDSLCRQVISLPMHTELSPDQQEYIVEQLHAFRP
ncbi:MAG TPA: DegT/DnrJ/EryC1/StrS family aminotransferase [Bacteroidetes bacterium]|nr:DegT/DnrJ/EryC1/StrS family aminotransferase [Bacteroidota bacterium]